MKIIHSRVNNTSGRRMLDVGANNTPKLFETYTTVVISG